MQLKFSKTASKAINKHRRDCRPTSRNAVEWQSTVTADRQQEAQLLQRDRATRYVS